METMQAACTVYMFLRPQNLSIDLVQTAQFEYCVRYWEDVKIYHLLSEKDILQSVTPEPSQKSMSDYCIVLAATPAYGNNLKTNPMQVPLYNMQVYYILQLKCRDCIQHFFQFKKSVSIMFLDLKLP